MPDVSVKNGWARVAFGEVVKLSGARSSHPALDGFERYVGLDHIDPDDLKIRRWGDVADGTTFTNIFRPGHVLFGKRRAYQRKVAVADFSGVCSGDIYVLEPKNSKLLPELLPFICQTNGFFEHAIGTSAGSLSPRTNWGGLANYEFALPPVDEQRRIAEALTSVESVRSSYLGIIAITSRLLESAAKHVFSEFLSDQTVPTRPLGELIDGGVRNGIFRTEEEFGSGLRLINVVDCYRGFRVPVALLERVPVSDSEYVSFSAIPGDVIFNRSSLVLSGIGHVCLVPESEERIVFECHLMRVRPVRQLLASAFLARYALSPIGRRYIRTRAQTTTMTTIGQPDLEAMPVPCPDLAVQEQCSHYLDAIDTTVQSARARESTVRAIGSEFLNSIWFA